MRVKAIVTELQVSDAERIVSGHACVWGATDKDRERIIKGACSEAAARQAAGRSTAFCWSHNHRFGMPPIGGTRLLAEDDHGLAFEADIDETDYAEGVRLAIKRKAVEGASIGFFELPGGTVKSSEPGVWDLLKIDLFEISACYRGVQPDAYVKSQDSALLLPKAFEAARAGKLKDLAVAAELLQALASMRSRADWMAYLADLDDGTETQETKQAIMSEAQQVLAYVSAIDLSKYAATGG